MNDTAGDVRRIYREMLMKRAPDERLMMGAHMFVAARALVLASFPEGLSTEEKRRALLERFYPEFAGSSERSVVKGGKPCR